MNVKELIERLQKCDPDKKVITEGCDCTGDIFSIQEGEEVFLKRTSLTKLP